MTRLYNDPQAFADEMIDGFVAANARWVRRVNGGVVRATRTEAGTVAVVVGGGSGHYPAFGGLVGRGLAHGAAMGNLFASPSAQQVHTVATAAERGAGVLFSYGNYAGDVLHFDQAQERLRAEGIECRTVRVTDDISSAPADRADQRRGIAGDLTVFKVAGAAADAGYDLDAVVRVAERANERTRSFGVAFSGCTLPGADAPLFTVPEGRMGVGMGIHGEPGIDEADVPSADGLAELLVSSLLAEVPASVDTVRGARVGVILNGLGSIKYEELFVVYRRVAQLLDDAGLHAVDPEVGELVTSFDMAGVSLTLFWLDDELERLWSAPCDTPAYRKGALESAELMDDAELAEATIAEIPSAGDASRQAAGVAVAALETMARTIDEHVDELGRLDAIAGDGDHGIGMQRGVRAAVDAARAALAAGAGTGTVLGHAGDAWADRAGGTSGALWGAILRAVAHEVGDENTPDAATLARGMRAASNAVLRFGAVPGDKTMVDALVPFADELESAVHANHGLWAAWTSAADAATVAAAASADLLPRMGRARPHSEKSLGTPDPGAHSFALLVRAVLTTTPEGRNAS